MSQEGGVSASARAVQPRAPSKRRGASAPGEGSSERAPKNRRVACEKTESASGFRADGDGAAGWQNSRRKRGADPPARKPLVEPHDEDGAAGGGGGAVEDDEAFARRLQEEENQRFERERAESRRRAEEWRRTHEALMFAADDRGPDPFRDEEDDDERDGSDEGDASFSSDAFSEGEVDADEAGEADAHARDATSAGADGDAARRGVAARRARGRLARMHRFFGAMHAHIHAAGRDARERGDLAALVLSDRDFTDQDYERLLTLDNVCVAKKGLSADAMARRGVVTRAWGEAKKTGDARDAPRCAVCLESFLRGDRVSRLPCTHQYHRACIERWLSSHVECPVCRVDLAETDARR